LHLRKRPKIDDLEEDAMTARRMAVALGVLLLATAGLARAQDDKAVHRGDGGGSHSSGAENRHPSQDVHSSSDSPSSGGSYAPEAFSSRTGAEQRHPRPGTGTGHRGYGGGYYGSPYYYRPYGYGYYPYDSFYGSFYYGYSPYYYSGNYGYSPYSYGYGRSGYSSYGYRTGSLRLLVEPNQARVYVDGYYAGIVDDFDGLFQRLNISPGRHEIMFKLDGFRTYRVRVYVPLDQTVKIHYRMVPGSGAEVDEATAGVPGEDPRYDSRYDPRGDDRYDSRDPRDSRDEGRYDARAPRDDERADSGEMGTLRCDVQPPDASVYVDGSFRGAGRQIRALSLPAGRHRIEIVRPGFRTVEREVEIRPGHTTDLGVDLER
jgi:hypothetical protein